MADDDRRKIRDLNELNNERIELLREINDLILQELRSGEAVFNTRQRTVEQEEYIANSRRLVSEYEEEINRLRQEGYETTENVSNQLYNQRNTYREISNNQKEQKRNLESLKQTYQNIDKSASSIWTYLMQADKTIKSTILNLGMSSAKAEIMRNSFEASAGYVTRLGGSLEDISVIMETFADETGRARALSAEMVKDVTKIGKGTGLGIEQAAKLAAQFEFMGVSVNETMRYVQGVVETSELMGVNTTKVMQNITDNFKRLQTFTFRDGVKGFATMAQNAEKLRVDMGSALDVAERARNLEEVVDMTAQLQVMGGEFAKTDPFQMLYKARNAPQELQKDIADMTKGLVQFRRNSEGVFETFISPADRDRIAKVAESLGMTNEELTEITKRTAERQRMRQQMVGMGLTEEEKEAVMGAAKLSKNTGRFAVAIGDTTKDIKNLTKSEISALKESQTSLDKRAKYAQTFDEAFQNTIEELKTALLPMLKGVNTILNTIRPWIIDFNEWVTNLSSTSKDLLKFGGMLLSGGFLIKQAFTLGQSVVQGTRDFLGIFKRGGGAAGAAAGGGRTAARAGGGTVARGAGAAAGRGTGVLKGGLGVGLAAAGTGGGIMMAAEGISNLADSLSKLTPKQADTLKSIGTTLAITFPAAAVGMTLAGKAATSSAVGIGVITGAVLGLGAAVNMATKGLSKMYDSIAKARTAKADAVKETALALKGSKDDFKEVEKSINAISKADLNNLKPLLKLGNILEKPLKVEFADKEVAIVSNITLNMDGYEMTQRIAERVPIVQSEMKAGKESGRK